MTLQGLLGIDVGSMSVKYVLLDPTGAVILRQGYRCHRGQQAATVFEMLTELNEQSAVFERVNVSVTGSGSVPLASALNATYVQEVSAAVATIERHYPGTRSAIDLGGQDAKIVIWEPDSNTKQAHRFTNMNDRCAGGTGATIDRIMRKLGLDSSLLTGIQYSPDRVHPVASKCGIFAETDIVGLVKQGVPVEDCIVSLCDAIVQQNLRSLTRGRQVFPPVLLLGGPHVYCPVLLQAWQHQLDRLWGARAFVLPKGQPLVHVPPDALFFAARGCVIAARRGAGTSEGAVLPALRNRDAFLEGCTSGDLHQSPDNSMNSRMSLDELRNTYVVASSEGSAISSLPGRVSGLFIGLDAGSTSTKAVAIDSSGHVVARAYRLSDGTPIDDAKQVLADLGGQIAGADGATTVRSLTVTGYARDYLLAVIGADHSVVETAAHAAGAQQFAQHVDVILDVGGQDIKVLFLSGGTVTDFRLNTQCSAGNGYYLQNAALRFGVPIERYAEVAFEARRLPPFKTGCAVFLESDIVTFQQQGWTPAEILAGLAAVLPKNVWEYVVQEPSLSQRGTRFLLQGGTHRNLAVVKAQVDYIQQRVADASIRVHPFAAEAGAIGAALLGKEKWLERGRNESSSFIGFAELARIRCAVRRDDSTRCSHCSNRCLRTLLTASVGDSVKKQITLAPCEKGTISDPGELQRMVERRTAHDRECPSYVQYHQKRSFGAATVPDLSPEPTVPSWRDRIKVSISHGEKQNGWRIGIPRTLNMWRYAPFFSAYLRAVVHGNVNLRWSACTNQRMWEAASHINRVDLCFPGKYAVAHIHDLLESDVDMIINPALVTLDCSSATHIGASACPVAMSNPDVVKAAFTGGQDQFVQKQVTYYAPVLHMDNPDLFDEELYAFARSAFHVSRSDHRRALLHGWSSYHGYYRELQAKAKTTLGRMAARNEVGILFLGRPYHCDAGLNHGVPDELQKRGYPIFTIESLPRDPEFLESIFGNEVAEKRIAQALDISDVWKHSLSENTNRKVWAAKVAARIPQLAIVDFVSFRCGLDAVVLHVIERIARCAGTPYFALHDMDQNKPTGSLNIRIETIDYYLKRYQCELAHNGTAMKQADYA